MKTTSERIKKGMDLRNLKQADLVKMTGISKGALSSYISGRYIPKQNNIYRIAKALNVNEAWLMGNDVPMARKSVSLETLQPQILKYYNQLNDIGQHKATEQVKDLTYIPQYRSGSGPLPNAAHSDNYDTASEKLKQLEEDIMDDENF